MPKITDAGLSQETLDGVMDAPERRRRAERIVDTMFAEVEYALRFNREPSALTKWAFPQILKWMETREAQERDQEAAAHFAAMREFVQSFRRADDGVA